MLGSYKEQNTGPLAGLASLGRGGGCTPLGWHEGSEHVQQKRSVNGERRSRIATKKQNFGLKQWADDSLNEES